MFRRFAIATALAVTLAPLPQAQGAFTRLAAERAAVDDALVLRALSQEAKAQRARVVGAGAMTNGILQNSYLVERFLEELEASGNFAGGDGNGGDGRRVSGVASDGEHLAIIAALRLELEVLVRLRAVAVALRSSIVRRPERAQRSLLSARTRSAWSIDRPGNMGDPEIVTECVARLETGAAAAAH